MNRRHFLARTSTGVLALSLPLIYSCGDVTLPPGLAHPSRLSVFLEEDSLRKLGKQYLSVQSAETSQRSLAKAILTHFSDGDPSTDEINDVLMSDFSTGETVILDGWILSRNEARQCALLSLLPPN